MRQRSVAADSAAAHADDLFRARLENQIDLHHPLAQLARRMPWAELEDALAPTLPPDPAGGGRPSLPVRLMAGLLYLKHAYDLSDEEVCMRWLENPYWQFFTGEVVFQTRLPCNPSSLTRWRQRLGEAGMEELAQTIAAARAMKAVDARDLSRVIVDTTVQEKAIAHPTDSRLLEVARKTLVRLSQRHDLHLRQTYAREALGLARKAGHHAHARQLKRMRRVLRRQRTVLGRVIRDIGRQMDTLEGAAREQMQGWLACAERIVLQEPKDKNKLVCVACAGGGVHRQRQGAPAVRVRGEGGRGRAWWCARSFPGNPYDGDTLEDQLEQVAIVSGTQPTTAIVDLGFRGREIEGVQVLHRGKPKSLTRRQWGMGEAAAGDRAGDRASERRLPVAPLPLKVPRAMPCT